MSKRFYCLKKSKIDKYNFSLCFYFNKIQALKEGAESCLDEARYYDWDDKDHKSYETYKNMIDIWNKVDPTKDYYEDDYSDIIHAFRYQVLDQGYKDVVYVNISTEYIEGSIPEAWLETSSSPKKTQGHTCKKCTTYNEYAYTNQPDDTYVCRSCSIFTNIFSN